jgi:hypothetical protein
MKIIPAVYAHIEPPPDAQQRTDIHSSGSGPYGARGMYLRLGGKRCAVQILLPPRSSFVFCLFRFKAIRARLRRSNTISLIFGRPTREYCPVIHPWYLGGAGLGLLRWPACAWHWKRRPTSSRASDQLFTESSTSSKRRSMARILATARAREGTLYDRVQVCWFSALR